MKLKMLFVLFVLFAFQCAPDSGITPKVDRLNLDVTFKDDYIVISDGSTLNHLLQKMAVLSPTDLDAWEADNHFSSLRSLMNRAVSEETKYFDLLEGLDEQSLNLEEIKPHADFVLEHASYFRFDDEGWFELNIANQNLAPLLNKDGSSLLKEKRENTR